MWIATLVLASSSWSSITTPNTVRTTVQVVVLDADTILVRSNQPIVSVDIADCYENTDFVLDLDPVRYEARIRLFTMRGPLRLLVETRVPGARNLKRMHVVTIPNPAEKLGD